MYEVLLQFKAGKYDRARGRLRSWIFGIARRRAADVVRARLRRPEGGDGALAFVEDEARVTREWEAVENREELDLEQMFHAKNGVYVLRVRGAPRPAPPASNPARPVEP